MKEFLEQFSPEAFCDWHRYDPVLSDAEREGLDKGWISFSEIESSVKEKQHPDREI